MQDKCFKRGTAPMDISSQQSNFKVVVRVRPPLPREIKPHTRFMPIVNVSKENKRCSIVEYLGLETEEAERQRDIRTNPRNVHSHNFAFDHIYGMEATEKFVYENTAKDLIDSVLQGYNATIFAYGQTGTGKTHTMEGFKYTPDSNNRGIIPRAADEVFRFIERCSDGRAFMVRASYLQIYKENVSDLFVNDSAPTLQIRENKQRGVYVDKLIERPVRSASDVYALLSQGSINRKTACTKLNDVSSRSHAVFIIIVEQMKQGADGGNEIRIGKMNFVDLAGSERVRITGASGERLEESKKINQSLSALGNVIGALTDKKNRTHIPYRDSKLTRLLEDSLGGNCKTTMMAMITPCQDAFYESLSSLRFAHRAKRIKNTATINEDQDERALLRTYEAELKRLKAELAEKNKIIEDSHLIDKSDPEIYKLEDRIKQMNNELLIGGKKIEETPQFRTAVAEQQRRIREEYDKKYEEIERERLAIEEDKAHVDRYKQLLLKQRDIMIALTGRLNERDQTILQLQDQLDAYDKLVTKYESKIESQTRTIEGYRRRGRDLEEDGLVRGSEEDFPTYPDLMSEAEALREGNVGNLLNEGDYFDMELLRGNKIDDLSAISFTTAPFPHTINIDQIKAKDIQIKSLQKEISESKSKVKRYSQERAAISHVFENDFLKSLTKVKNTLNITPNPQLSKEIITLHKIVKLTLHTLLKDESVSAIAKEQIENHSSMSRQMSKSSSIGSIQQQEIGLPPEPSTDMPMQMLPPQKPPKKETDIDIDYPLQKNSRPHKIKSATEKKENKGEEMMIYQPDFYVSKKLLKEMDSKIDNLKKGRNPNGVSGSSSCRTFPGFSLDADIPPYNPSTNTFHGADVCNSPRFSNY